MAGLREKEFLALAGLSQAKAQLRQLPDVIKAAVYTPLKDVAYNMATRARAMAPVRAPQVGYPGGMLRASIMGRASKKNAEAMVGLQRGLLIARHGLADNARLTQTHLETRRYQGKDGKLHVKRYQRFLGNARRSILRHDGALIIQPTKYGHLMEFGTARGIPPRSFMRTAANASRMSFESAMRGVAPDVIRALQQLGYQPTSGGGA